jgi:putative proteasome-type protease
MSYCVGVLLEQGLVLSSDSRTNAGVDNVATFRKMTIYEVAKERVVAILCAGNLALTQSALSLIEEWTRGDDDSLNVLKAPSLFRVARIVGSALREVHGVDGEALSKFGTEFNASFLVGGQIAGERTRLFHIYAAGNFIEATPETPFFQLGETKYGKPVLDRLLNQSMTIEDTTKLVLISFDSTMRSNLSVGPPIHLFRYLKDSLRAGRVATLTDGDAYLLGLRRRWAEGLRSVFEELPGPPLDPA